MNPLLNLHTWVSLPNEVRFKIRTLFNIPRSSNTVVNDGKIETDGVTPEDISHLTTDKMKTYLTSEETDFNKLFDLVVAKVVDELNPKKIPIINANPQPDVKKISKKSKK